MTSFAFILGVVPLVLSEGAGAEMRRTLGTAVFGGMLGVTLFGIFLTPVFYYVIQRINDLARWMIPRRDFDQPGSNGEAARTSDPPDKPLIQRPARDAQLTVVQSEAH